LELTSSQVLERVGNGEDEGDDDPRYGGRCGDGPGVGLFEPIDEAFPPVVVLREDYEGCEEPATGGQTQWDLLEVDESLDDVPAIVVIDG
jgi:hypothetical protein